MRDFDIDKIIEPPPGGLIGYRSAVESALNRARHGFPDATWASLQAEPAQALPSDPDWAGEIVYTDERTVTTVAQSDDVWNAAEKAVNGGRWSGLLNRWSVAECEPGTRLLLRATARAPGRAWLDITVTPRDGGGSRYTQRAIFVPTGLPGRLSWFMLRPLQTAAMRALLCDVVRPVKRRTAGAMRAP